MPSKYFKINSADSGSTVIKVEQYRVDWNDRNMPPNFMKHFIYVRTWRIQLWRWNNLEILSVLEYRTQDWKQK